MELNPSSETNISSATEEFISILWNSNFNYMFTKAIRMLIKLFTGDPMAVWAVKCIINLPIPTCAETLVLITTQPASMPYFPRWFTG
jgi:hypothetical protein